MLLSEWHLPITTLSGLGVKTQTKLERLGIATMKDLLLYFPRTYLDRTVVEPLAGAEQKQSVSCLVRVVEHQFIGRGFRKILKITIEDKTAQAYLLCFNRPFLAEQLKLGHYFLLTGSFNIRFKELQTARFE